jgi:hypothetical protein
MNSFSILEALSFGWQTFKSSWKGWLIALALGGFGGFASFQLPSKIPDFNKNSQLLSSLMPKQQIRQPKVLSQSISLKEKAPYSPNTHNYDYDSQTNTYSYSNKSNHLPNIFPFIRIILLVIIFFLPLVIVAIGISSLASTILQMGFINLCIAAGRGEPFNYQLILKNASGRKAVRFMLSVFVYAIVVLVGFLLLVIPGIYFAIKYCLFPYVTVEENPGILASLRRSSELTKGVKLKLLLFYLVSAFLQIIGFLMFGIGILVTLSICYIAAAYIYTRLNPQVAPSPQPAPAPSSPPQPQPASQPNPLPATGPIAEVTPQTSVGNLRS